MTQLDSESVETLRRSAIVMDLARVGLRAIETVDVTPALLEQVREADRTLKAAIESVASVVTLHDAS